MASDPYTAAPSIPWETVCVIRLLPAFGEGPPLGLPTTDERRETLLRTAELLDRLALTEPDDHALDIAATKAGDELAAFNRVHDTEGDAGEGSVGRAYTRRAYAVWIAHPRTLPD